VKERVLLVRVPLYFMRFINLYYRHVFAHILATGMAVHRSRNPCLYIQESKSIHKQRKVTINMT
jgi:hypothetical protein